MFPLNKKGRDVDFRCSFCGKFVPYDRRITQVDIRWEYAPFSERGYECYSIYHKHCHTLWQRKLDSIRVNNVTN